MTTLKLTIRPEFFRLPTNGVDPYFGLSRAYYYSLDKTGQVLLVRLRRRGSLKGVTLINYEAMSAFLTKAAKRVEESKPAASDAPLPPAPVAGNVHRLVNLYPEDTELMRKLTPSLLHDLLMTISSLEQAVQAAPHGE